MLHESGLCESREEARKLILAGKVRVSKDRIVRKASEEFTEEDSFIIDEKFPFVSRGALKLLPAIEKYLPDLSGLVAMDIGASTGGFTDLMLQRNVLKVYAIDVGHGQLHQKLRNDTRVIVFEKTNARHLDENFLPEKVDVLSVDVSFISLALVLPPASKLLTNDFHAFVLVKPQFEAERGKAPGGVVKDLETRLECVRKIANFAETALGWKLLESLESEIKGPKGNREYMLVFRPIPGN